MNLGKRIKFRLDELGVGPQWLANKVPNLDVKSLCALIARDSKRSQFSAGIAKALGVTNEWLLTGDGEMLEESRKPPEEVDLENHPDLTPIQRVKFKLSAGVCGFAVEHEDGNGTPIFFRATWFKQHGYTPEKLFAVRVNGASMEPSLWDQDLVVVNTDDSTPVDGEVFAINYEGELVIKRMRRDSGEWFACSDNADNRRFAPKRCHEGVCLIGRVVYKQSERI